MKIDHSNYPFGMSALTVSFLVLEIFYVSYARYVCVHTASAMLNLLIYHVWSVGTILKYFARMVESVNLEAVTNCIIL